MNNNLICANASLYVGVSILAIAIILLCLFIGLVPVGLWFKSIISKAYVGVGKLVQMKMRKVDVALIVNTYINAKNSGIDIDIEKLENHYVAGGNIVKVVDALISAKGANLNMSFETASALDLSNQDVLQLVKANINPTIINTSPVHAVAGDGIELIVKARVTLKADLDKLVGVSNEEGVVSKIGEVIVSTISSLKEHSVVLKDPTILSKTIIGKNIDKDYAYKIIGIDVSDIKVGRNIGAKLEAERAEAEKQIAKAKAEERKSLAIAAEHEMRARTQEKRAQLLDAEAEVPKALTTAFRSGRIGVMEFYKMKDVFQNENKNKKDGE